MTTDAGQFKEAVRDQWTHAATAWGQWHPKFSEMSREVTEAICEAADLRPGQQVLDLAGGTGEPGLTAAGAVAPGGTVTCTDFVQGMVDVAQANARAAGIDNMKFQQVDAEDIPFGDNTFDRVVSRFGIMFPPNTQQALSEIKRVLKPGGRVAFTVWQGIDKNGWFGDINSLLREKELITPPPPGMPSPFRFAEAGSISREMTAAGLKDVQETPRRVAWSWPGPPDEMLGFMQGTFPAWRRGLEQADAQVRERTLGEMRDIIARSYDGSRINLGGNIYVATATK